MDDIAVELAKDLDRAFPEVVEKMGGRLYWGLRRLSGGDHQDAEDLTQEALIRAYQALAGYDGARIRDLRVEPWLWTIALNLGRNHLRDRARRPTLVAAVETPLNDPELFDETAWDRRLSALNTHQRTAVVLRHVVGLGVDEIAEAVGRPAGTVKADIHRGLAKLRGILEAES